jgi:diguanylate cyclase (GGDEF)-like protein
MDLDHFKKINDTYGHQAGDVVLQEATACVASILRPYDILARYGGEEFIIFVAEINRESVIQLTERIRCLIAETKIQINDTTLSVTSSFGVAPAAPVNDLDSAISLADSALYQAKQEGRNKVCYAE